jgi:hypothetical protein
MKAQAQVNHEQRTHGKVRSVHRRISKAERERARQANRSTLPWGDV